jgi:hypothetical protein
MAIKVCQHFLLQTLVEVEYQVPLDSLNASKLARVWRIPGKFFKLGGDGAAEAAAVDIQSMVVQLAFQRPSLRGAWNRQFMFRKFHSVFNDACKSWHFPLALLHLLALFASHLSQDLSPPSGGSWICWQRRSSTCSSGSSTTSAAPASPMPWAFPPLCWCTGDPLNFGILASKFQISK